MQQRPRLAGQLAACWLLLWGSAKSGLSPLLRAVIADGSLDVCFGEQADISSCFTTFDRNEDGKLDEDEFSLLCRGLFRDGNGEEYPIEPQQLSEMFNVFDKNQDGVLDAQEFIFCWDLWIKTITRPISAFVIVDVQNDFISGSLDIRGSPAKQNGAEVIEPTNQLLSTVNFAAVACSLDWHPANHVSFIDNIHLRKLDPSSPVSSDEAKVYDTVIFEGSPPMKQKLWPKHCEQTTWGAELHKDLKVPENVVRVYKGTNPDVDSYSAFWDNSKLSSTVLLSELKQRDITDVYVSGIAYDVCVGATAVDSLDSGFRTILVDDCSRGVDLDGIEETKQKVASLNGIVVNSSQVKDMVEGADRRPELGYKLAKELNSTNSN